MQSLKNEFLLNPDIIFLNHGSFGATPKPVFDVHQNWQRRMERQPVLFLAREFNEHLLQSRIELGKYLNADPQDLVYIPNATFGANILARSLKLEPGDEILATDHEYGACSYAWEFVCQKTGAAYIQHAIPLPVHSEEEIVDLFWAGVTRHTRVIYISHITSPTALRLPVELICQRARRAGILTIIDAAHSPGQIPLDLTSMDPDFAFGNCHKWMLAPKGSAFLYARTDVQNMIEPLIVSWGLHPTIEIATGSRFVDLFQWTGTNDPAPVLSIPSAIQFMKDHNWETVRLSCHILLGQAIRQICEITKMKPLYPLDSDLYIQMGIAPLPENIDLALLSTRLYKEYRIEVPLICWQSHNFIRISVQGYNTSDDIETLVTALSNLLQKT